MLPEMNIRMMEEAIRWQIRLRDGRGADWDAFTEWLEQNPLHSAAYGEVALRDHALDGMPHDWQPASTPLANDNEAGRWSVNRRWIASGLGAVVAAAALAIFLPALPSRYDYYYVVTGPGKQRVVILENRDRIDLNGDTRLRLDHNDLRFAALEQGEANFTVTHDPAHPFVVQLGDQRIQDVGTRFNVIHSPTVYRIAVAEGSILYQPDHENIFVKAGQSLITDTVTKQIQLKREAPSDIGGWRRGQLSYNSTSLALVLADVSRNLGTTVEVNPTVARRTFTGTIEIDRNQTRMFTRLSKLLEVDARRSGQGWNVEPEETGTSP